MPDSNSKKPLNWEDYEYGRSPRNASDVSLGGGSGHVQFDGPSPSATSGRLNVPRTDGSNAHSPSGSHDLRSRRSSLSMRMSAITHAGGVNSLESFARSWSRAAGFADLHTRQPSFIVTSEDEEAAPVKRPLLSSAQPRSLLREQFQREASSSQAILDDESSQNIQDQNPTPSEDHLSSTPPRNGDLLAGAPYLASPFASSYGGVYGSLSSRVNSSSMRHAGELYHQQQQQGRQEPDKEQQPLLVKVVEQKDGQRITVVIGQSTLPQTVFNSVNVLIGVGLLSLPLALKYSGWLIGLLFLFFAAVTTKYTAGVLAKCLDVNPELIGFADVAYQAFGRNARIATGILFTFELVAACIALVVLFADSLDDLIPGWGRLAWKILCGVILAPLSFVPLRYLSVSSVLGIISCFGIVLLVFVDGFLKPQFPGSLRDPAPMAGLFPQRWSTVPLSLGLLMSPWGGHSVFPNIYRDMRHPQKYNRAMNYTYVFTYGLDVAIAIAGFLMFGQRVHDEVTSSVLITSGYPHSISIIIVVFIAIIPLTKVPLK
ncbi:hypothetical protein ACLMJK_001557 [Lecanora helva]